jgi:hypothetical protein
MRKKRIEYIISILISLILFELGLFYALSWYWSGFEWSPFGYETCGMEFIAILLLTYPAFILGLLIRIGLIVRWKILCYVWILPLILCGIASCAFNKSLVMGIFCIASMFALPIADFLSCKKIQSK